MRYRLQAVMDFLHRAKKYVSANEVATSLGMSWNTAKKDLDLLAARGYIIKTKDRVRPQYRFNYRR